MALDCIKLIAGHFSKSNRKKYAKSVGAVYLQVLYKDFTVALQVICCSYQGLPKLYACLSQKILNIS